MVKLLQFTLRDFGPIYTPPQNVCREWVVVVMCRNWGIIRARDIAIRHLHKYPTFRMLHSLGGPLFYIYTLTVDGRTADAAGTNPYGRDREGEFPSLGSPMADDNRPTNASLTGTVFPSVTSRGGELVSLIRVLDRVYIVPRRYLTDWWYECVAKSTYWTSR